LKGVAARAAIGEEVGALFLFGQGEELLGQRPGAGDQIVIDAVILHHGKAELAEALPDVAREVGGRAGEREDGECGEIHG
jgi:hypothetical protein